MSGECAAAAPCHDWPACGPGSNADATLETRCFHIGCAVGGLARVYVTHGVLRDAAAIAASLFLIVLASILLGTALPFALSRMGLDPAHAGSSIQVGVTATYAPRPNGMPSAFRLVRPSLLVCGSAYSLRAAGPCQVVELHAACELRLEVHAVTQYRGRQALVLVHVCG
jgi:hypothetical protein